ncbi:alkaline phosphatase PafA [Aquimarina brevivitae]|uniref:Putative AlkP superfamily pyrophosphatase or phosphodiesterase n=1 Tax=Aquimarina brevivitae TaxID=323412 RepID=A0A4Q7PH82_9FLAO|nr:alkaline phosphatase PafA [Aquimarina brevivitae]RZS99906.1 putative AlkP superfamily pyrophosphatase or phosphodiesterase [Aquimarina brevivitae]
MKSLFYFTFLLATLVCFGQQKNKINQNPKLVVGIVVDQMRYDYLTRFYNHYGDDGFKRLINEGFNCKNNHFNYVPTYTGPGHASIYTGTTPLNHGIISNNWYDKFSKKTVYCAYDPKGNPVGTDNMGETMSPHLMLTTTVTDQNRLHTQFRGKTIGVSIKDRGAVLPAGHTANAAYWFRGKNEGNWITSDYYVNELPQWVVDFNKSRIVENYVTVWNTLKPVETYIESGADDTKFEGGFTGKETPTFPYDLEVLKEANGGYDIIKSSPYGNSLTTDFAFAAIDGESLGADEITDFLTISYSSTDYIGHNFGVNSKEIQDTYIRLDKEIARLLAKLDNTVGKGAYTVFLTADHGAVNVPAYLKSVKIPAGYVYKNTFQKNINEFLRNKFKSDSIIENISNNQIFFNYKQLEKRKINASELQKVLADYLINQEQIDKVYTRDDMESVNYTQGIASLIQKGFHQKRSGDVFFVFDPANISYSFTGSTHGSGMTYDTHAPLLFFGNGIRQGSTFKKTKIIDIAPTISALLGIAFPNGASGEVLMDVLE